MPTYVVFMRNKATGEEFVAPIEAPVNAHRKALTQMKKSYPADQFDIHTTYTFEELENVLDGLQRWPGVASRPQRGARPVRPVATTAIPKPPHPFDTGSMLQGKGAEPKLQPTPEASATAAAAAQQGKSVIDVLKALRS
jgi:hypothetical protein